MIPIQVQTQVPRLDYPLQQQQKSRFHEMSNSRELYFSPLSNSIDFTGNLQATAKAGTRLSFLA
jgi:hypothetical protein